MPPPQRVPRNISPTRTDLDYHALTIGINDYKHLPKLRTACQDAKTVEHVLRNDYAFKTRLLLDATRAQILTALTEYRLKLATNDGLLIYYAGHGWLDQEADRGYWLPADATSDNQVAWIANDAVTSELRAIRARHVPIVADSCHAGKLTRGLVVQRKSAEYWQQIASRRARVVLSSGGLEPVLDSGGGQHSVFASAFLKALRTNEKALDGATLFSTIRRPIMLESDQVPEYGDIRKAGHEGGDFLFIRNK